MFKKALQAAATFGVLLAGYAGYVRVFALLASGVGLPPATPGFHGGKTMGKTGLHAIDLAVGRFGKGHWAAAPDLPIRIYNADRGFWMYARDYKRLDDGKQIEFTPFAIIWESRDGRSFKTATSDSARIDLDQPLGLVTKPGASSRLRVVHARLEGEVKMRDDKGTADPRDDLKIGPLTYIEYDEPSLQIASESEVVIEDNIYRITGLGLLIKLRPKADGLPGGSAAGFDGAQTAYLKRKVHIVISDVGPAGILPGDPKARPRAGERSPLDLRCNSMMQVDLPRPRLPVRVGPPAPPEPTVAQFNINVEVLRGKKGAAPDRLTCDHLRLTLVPPDKDAAPVAVAAAPGPKAAASGADPEGEGEPREGDAMTDLTLKRADATGHNVRLVSAGQGVKARCNQLIHKKNLPDAPDETYFRGDATTRLDVEKTDATSFTTIRTVDATIFDDGRGNEFATVVARGPGELESRPATGQPVKYVARWLDQLTLQPEPPVPGATADATERSGPVPAPKRITLTGRPSFADLSSESSLDARRVLVVWLRPKPRAVQPAAEAAGSASAPAGGAFDLDKLVALGDVHLTTPGKTLTARDRLDAVFQAPADPAKPAAAAAVVADSGAGVGAEPAASAAPNAAPAGPSEPDAKARANVVWASLVLKPAPTPAAGAGSSTSPPPGAPGLLGGGSGSGRRAEIDKMYMRGDVSYRQDPGPGKTRGTEVVGEAVDVVNRGPDGTRFSVFHRDPDGQARQPAAPKAKTKAKTKARPKADDPADDDLTPLALVQTEEMTIRGKVIGLDQATDMAWVDGRGSLTQMAARGLLSDKGLANPPKPGAPGAGPEVKQSPMTIAFANGMKFFGRSTDRKGRPAARAEFYRDVHAENDDSTLDCQDVMRAYFDRTVKLARPGRDPKAPAASPEPKAEIASIECVSQVVVVNSKTDPATKAVLQKQRIEGEYLVYDKADGKFHLPGAGKVYLYEREGRDGSASPKLGAAGAGDRPASDPRVVLTAGPARTQPAAPRPTAARAGVAPAVGRNSVRNPADLSSDRPRPTRALGRPSSAAVSSEAAPGRPLVLTQITFRREMRGRFGTGKDADRSEPREADFFGDVQAYRARVPDADSLLDPDSLPSDGMLMTAQVLRVRSEPVPPTRDDADPPPRNLLRAWENANVVTEDKTIQADTITYNSETSLFWAYGEDGRDVVIAQQGQVGQGYSVTQGSAAMFNSRTGQASLIDPKSVALVDARTGYRPTPTKPADTTVKPRRPPRIQFRNLRGSVERKDFTGR